MIRNVTKILHWRYDQSDSENRLVFLLQVIQVYYKNRDHHFTLDFLKWGENMKT